MHLSYRLTQIKNSEYIHLTSALSHLPSAYQNKKFRIHSLNRTEERHQETVKPIPMDLLTDENRLVFTKTDKTGYENHLV
jgi:hypothetical protein